MQNRQYTVCMYAGLQGFFEVFFFFICRYFTTSVENTVGAMNLKNQGLLINCRLEYTHSAFLLVLYVASGQAMVLCVV